MYWILLWTVMLHSSHHQLSGWECGRLAWELRQEVVDWERYGTQKDVIWFGGNPKGGERWNEKGNYDPGIQTILERLPNLRRYKRKEDGYEVWVTGGDVGDHFVGIKEMYIYYQ